MFLQSKYATRSFNAAQKAQFELKIYASFTIYCQHSYLQHFQRIHRTLGVLNKPGKYFLN